MRLLLLAPGVVLMTACAAAVACAAAPADLHPRALVTAALVSGLAALAAVLPAWLNRRSSHAVLVPMALAGTGLHLLLLVALPVAAWAGGLVRDARPFALWLLMFYCSSLAGVSAALIVLIHRAPAGAAAANPPLDEAIPQS